MINVALAGNANCGKTTLFNALTGANQFVGNWPGVTVEKKSGRLKKHKDVVIQDLPGIYSLSPYSPEEVVSRRYLIDGRPDVIVNVIDGTNLERNLYLTLQLMETGLPIICAVNMVDLLKKQGKRINLKKMEYLLGVPVIGISALKKTNLDVLIDMMIEEKHKEYSFPKYDDRLESALSMIEDQLRGVVSDEDLRFYAIKFFEQDDDVWENVALDSTRRSEIEELIKTAEKVFGDETGSIVANARYDFIARIVDMSIVNEKDFVMTASDYVDMVVTNRILALPIFVLVMWLVYYISIQTIGGAGSDWVNDVLFGELVPDTATALLKSWHVASWMQGLIIDGIIGGVGAVLGFVPQIAVLFLCLGILEDCGYMARVAFVMDRIFHRFNLSGKSFIPLLISTGCGVPGIMSTRTIESEKDRKMTIMLTTFMPCSAKLTIIGLISGTFFPHQSWVAPSAYFIGMAAVVCSGIFLKKTQLFAGETQPFVMELPAYHLPKVLNILRYSYERSIAFIQKAGTIIFASMVLIWFLSSFNFKMQMVSQQESMLKTIGSIFVPIFKPLGFGDWHACAAVFAGLIAKENCISTIQVTFGNPSNAVFDKLMLSHFSSFGAYSFLVFNLLCAPCFAAISAMNKEFGDYKWTLRAVGYQTLLAYLAALVICQSSVILSGSYTWLNVLGVAIGVLIFAYGLVIKRPAKTVAAESRLAKEGI